MTHLVVIGAGMAGLPCAIRAADAGAQVTLIESADNVGGKLPRSSGQISAAGTRLQAEKGIVDSADDHFADVMRICHETADPNVVRLAVNHAAATVDWLQDIGVRFPPDHPVISYNHDVYRTRRYQWPVEKGKSILAALRPLLAAHIKAGRIDLHLNTAMTAIDRDAEGAVTAIRVQNADGAEETEMFIGMGRGLMRRELDRAVSSFAVNNGNYMRLENSGVLLAPEVNGLQFRYFDGTQWYDQWDSLEMDALPLAVEVTLFLDTGAETAENGMVNPITNQVTDSDSYFRMIVAIPTAVFIGEEEVDPEEEALGL